MFEITGNLEQTLKSFKLDEVKNEFKMQVPYLELKQMESTFEEYREKLAEAFSIMCDNQKIPMDEHEIRFLIHCRFFSFASILLQTKLKDEVLSDIITRKTSITDMKVSLALDYIQDNLLGKGELPEFKVRKYAKDNSYCILDALVSLKCNRKLDTGSLLGF